MDEISSIISLLTRIEPSNACSASMLQGCLSLFNLLSKFHKKTDDTSLDSLSNTNWSTKKEKAKARIYDHASEILKIESDRLKATSSTLKVSDDEYSSFINDFPFDDTEDQEIVSRDIR